jgi:hypothetical protein
MFIKTLSKLNPNLLSKNARPFSATKGLAPVNTVCRFDEDMLMVIPDN